MRPLVVLITMLVLPSCTSNWQLADDIETGCRFQQYWFDGDGDGWGEAGSEPNTQCGPDVTTGFTATNDWDCDDDDPAITGRIATLCPQDLVPSGVEFMGVVSGSKELVVVLPGTELVYASKAHHVCSEYGWGGDLASLTRNDLLRIQEALVDLPVWAGFVGFVPDGEGGWAWQDGTPTDGVFRSCEVGYPNSDEVDPTRAWLALVKRGENDWCLGDPAVAVPAAPAGYEVPDYQGTAAFFVCARERPDPADYNWQLL